MADPTTSTTYYYPRELQGNTGEYKHRITFSALKRAPSKKVPGSHGMVALYLPPEALKTGYTQGWGDTDMGAVGQAILNNAADQGATRSLFTSGSLSEAMASLGKGSMAGTGETIKRAIIQAGARASRKMVTGGAAALGGPPSPASHVAGYNGPPTGSESKAALPLVTVAPPVTCG